MAIMTVGVFIIIQAPTSEQGRFNKKEVMGELHAM
jgi:hypothetical protein